MNYEPDRPEAEIMQEYVEAWDQLYEPSRYLARAYRYYLAMRPASGAQAVSRGEALPKDRALAQGLTLRRMLIGVKSVFKILWWQGLRPSYRRQVWSQLLGMWRQNPTRFRQYFLTCVEGEDLFAMRKVVREKAATIIRERQIEVQAAPRGGFKETTLEPSSSGAIQDN